MPECFRFLIPADKKQRLAKAAKESGHSSLASFVRSAAYDRADDILRKKKKEQKKHGALPTL